MLRWTAPSWIRPARAGSPDLTAGLAHHRHSRAAPEGPGELGHVGDRSDRAELAERMLVGLGHQARELGTVVGGPDAAVRHEEPLVCGQPVDRPGLRLALERLLVGAVRDRQAA